MENTISDNFLDYKNSFFLAFDESISQDTIFDGNERTNSIRETQKIVNMIINTQKITVNIENIILEKFIEAINKTQIFETPNDITPDNKYFLAGWYNHAILIFYEKNSDDDKYTLGFVNAGEGAEFHQENYNLNDGIFFFENVSFETIKNFFIEYELFYEYSQLSTFDLSKNYYGFYKIIYDIFNENIDYDKMDFMNLKGQKTIAVYPQVIGSCAFTNIIYFMAYLLYKNNTNTYLNIFNSWYSEAKKCMCNILYSEMKKNKLKYFNELNYINDLYNIDNEKNNITQSQINITTYIKMDISDNDYYFKDISKNYFIYPILEIVNSHSHYNISVYDDDINNIINFYINNKMNINIYSIYKKNENLFVDIIMNLSNKTLPHNYLFSFYIIKNYIINNHSKTEFDHFLKILLKNYSFMYALKYNNNNTNTNNYSPQIKPLLWYTLCLDVSKINDKYYLGDFDKANKNKKLYKLILMNLPIMNIENYNIISLIIDEIEKNIFYYPDITKHNNYLENNLFNACLKNCSLNNFEADKIYNSNIDGYNNILSRFMQSDNVLSNISMDDHFMFETYGFIESIKKNNDFINLEEFKESNIDNVGCYKSFLSKIKLLETFIQKKLDEDILYVLHYIIYFYICELSDKIIEQKYIKKYNNDVMNNKLQDLIDTNFYILIQKYILKYDKYITITKEKINIYDNFIIIPKTEKKFFKEHNYDCESIKLKYNNNNNSTNYYKGLINFYEIHFETINIIEVEEFNKLLIYRYDDSTDNSLFIIINLLKKYAIPYIALNFTFEYISNNIFIGTDKNNNLNKIYWCSKHDLFYYMDTTFSDKIFNIILYKDLTNFNYKKFYNIMIINDPTLLLLQDVKDLNIYYLKSNLYDVEFEFNDDKIYCSINSIRYKVLFDADEDTYLNYGIFKLCFEDDTKILCFYNIKNLFNHKSNPASDNKSYINFKSLKIEIKNINYKDIKPKNLESYYVLININKDTLILKNENDVMAILINCLLYNSPKLILKSILQIKTIIETYNIDKPLLNFMFSRSINIYTLFIYTVLFDYKKLHNYNYKYYNKILKKYKYNFELKKVDLLNCIHGLNFNYQDIYPFNDKDLLHKIKNYSNQLFKYIITENEFKQLILKEITIFNPIIKEITITKTKKDNVLYVIISESGKSGKYLFQQEIELKMYMYSNHINNYNANFDKPLEKKIVNFENIIISTFKCLLEKNILNLNINLFNKNIFVANNLHNYLVNNHDVNTLYPIQELIMGSGKSSVITPYTIILLYNYLIEKKYYDSKIYVVVPEFLLNQTFETMMTNLYPICFEIDIILFKKEYVKNYINSIELIIISDIDLKELFLTKDDFDMSKLYFIYDEVDTIANPLINELNIPINETKKKLKNIDIIYDLTNFIYLNFFKNDDFWNNDSIKDYVIHNIKHKYLIDINNDMLNIINTMIEKDINEILIKKYKNNFDSVNNIKKLFEYFKKNIITYIFTKQFNYDYGIPLNYDSCTSNISDEYKYKAIPYLGGDSPLYGSSFSDSILSYVLTYFSYKLLYPQIRVIDIENMLNVNEAIFDDLKNNFFDNPPESKNDFLNCKMHYLNKLKNVFNLNDDFMELYIKEYLNKNITYYEKCNNISFTDLLLKKNVKKYVGFTGTAYIQLPEEEKIKYIGNTFITRSLNNDAQTVEKIIELIILNKNKMIKYYKNKDNLSLIDNIFECIKDYDVLIDIGAVFINLSNEEFIKKYNEVDNKKTYLVYFNNGIKVYNMITNQYVNESSLNRENKNTFFYFSNKNITGVDAKKFMNITAKALVTISIKTNLRDFSQGIFRMRNIEDTQTFDLLIDYKMINIYKRNKKEIQIGRNCFEEISDETRESIFNLLDTNQKSINILKEKILQKQNILGIVKKNTTDGECFLYLDPQNNKDALININDHNLLEKKSKFTTFTTKIYNKYITNTCLQSNVSTIIEKQIEKQVEINQIRNSTNCIEKNISVCLNILNFVDDKNFIYFSIHKKIDYSMIIILYNNTKNNLYIIPISYIDTILKYNEINYFIKNFTIISIHNDNTYGNSDNMEKYFMLKILSKKLLEKHNNVSYLKTEEKKNLENNKSKYDELIKTFKNYYNFNKDLL